MWHIQTPLGSRINLTINEYDIEPSNHEDGGCLFDKLSIYGGPDRTSPRLTELCSRTTNPTKVISTGNNMLVTFYSDGSIRGKGFSAHYSSEVGGK